MEDEIEELAKKRVQTRLGFDIHASMYLAMNVGLVVIWYLTGRGYPWFLWPILGWGIGVLAHAITLWIGPGSDVERRALDRERRRLRQAAGRP